MKKTFDQWYTPAPAALSCAGIVKQFIHPQIIIEPSGGEGALIDAALATFGKVKVISFDIDPKRADIIQADFLYVPVHNSDNSNTVVFANPPFGKRADLAIKFFNRSALLADTLAFIVPLQFRKWSVQSKLDPEMRLVHDSLLPEDTFDGIRCCFQVWKKGGSEPDLRLKKAPAIKHQDFIMWQYNNTKEALWVFDETFIFAVPRQGFADYTRRETDRANCELTTQWILFYTDNPVVLMKLRALDFETLAKRNTTTPGFGKADVIQFYNEVYGGN